MDKKTAFIILAVVIVGLIIWNVAKNKAQEEAEWERELRLMECEESAYRVYTGNWNDTCRVNFLPSGCALNSFLANGLDEGYEKSLDRCVQLYK